MERRSAAILDPRHHVRARRTRRTAGILAGAGALLLAATATASAQDALRAAPLEPGPADVIVRFQDGVGANGRAAALGATGVRGSRVLPNAGFTVARVKPGTTAVKAAAALRRRRDVVWAEPDLRAFAHVIPNDPLFGEQWGHHNTGQPVGNAAPGTLDVDVDVPEAWNANTGSSAVVVGVVDTGLDLTNPDLAPKIWTNSGESGGGKETNGVDDDGNGFVDDFRGYDFADDDNDPQELSSGGTIGPPIAHGTGVGSIIGGAANNGHGVAGVSQGARLMGLRALGTNGSGFFSDIADAMAYGANNNADIINMSLGSTATSQAVSDVINANPDVLFVTSAGNNGDNNDTSPQFPCADPAPNNLCVAATDRNDALAGFSNFGATSVDIAAPGVATIGSQNATKIVYSDDFESGTGDWASGGANNTWAATTTRSTSGTTSVTDSPPELQDYANNTNSFFVQTAAAAVDLSGERGCRLNAMVDVHVIDAPSPDGDVLEILASAGDADLAPLDLIVGDSKDTFVRISADLRAFDGGPVRVGFGMFTGTSGTGDGVYIDDVNIACIGDTYDGTEFAYLDGTSFSAPYAAGAAAVLASDGLSPQQIKDAIMAGGDPVPSLSGRTVSGRRLNLVGAMQAAAGPVAPPAPPPVTIAGSSGSPRVGRLSSEINAGPPALRLGNPIMRGREGYLPVTVPESAAIDGTIRGSFTTREYLRQFLNPRRATKQANATRIVTRTRTRRATKRVSGLQLPAGRTLVPLGRLTPASTLRVRLTATDEQGARSRPITRTIRAPRQRSTTRRSNETLPTTPATPGPESPTPPAPPAPPALIIQAASPPAEFDLCSLFAGCDALSDELRRPLRPGGPSRAELANAAGQPVPPPPGVFVGFAAGSPAPAATRPSRRIVRKTAIARLTRLQRRFRGGVPYVSFRLSRDALVSFEASRAAPRAQKSRLDLGTWTVRGRRGLNVFAVPKRWRCVRATQTGSTSASGASYVVIEAQHRRNVRITGNRLVGTPNPTCLA